MSNEQNLHKSSIISNFYKLKIDDTKIPLYKSSLLDNDNLITHRSDVIKVSKDTIISLTPVKNSETLVEYSKQYLAWLLRKEILNKFTEHPDSFDINERRGEVTFRKEKVFEENNIVILRRVSLHVILLKDEYFLCVNTFLKTYLRIGLDKVIDIYPEVKNNINGKNCLIFFEKNGIRKWLPARIIYADELATVELSNIAKEKYQIYFSRVIPFLNRKEINEFIIKSGQNWDYNSTIKKVNFHSSKATHITTNDLIKKYIKSIFPISSSLNCDLTSEMTSFCNDEDYTIVDPKVSFIVERRNIVERGIHRLKTMSNFHLSKEPLEKYVVLIAQKNHLDDLRNVVNTLNNGITQGKYFFSLPDKFGIKLKIVVEEAIDSSKNYSQTSDKILASLDKNVTDALVMVHLPKMSDQYLPLKAKLAYHGKISQMISQNNYDINSCWNLGANIYAKYGLKPWGISCADNDLLPDLIIGFSYSQLKSESGMKRNIGYVNVFDKHGVWQFMNTATEYLDFDKRHILIPQLISQAILSFSSTKQPLSKIDIHYSKRFSKRERIVCINEINKVMPSINEICFVSVDNSHEMHLFDLSHEKYEVEQGTVLPLNENDFLLSSSSRNNTINPLRPLKVSIWNGIGSTQIDQRIIAKRIMALTKLNWRSAIRDSSEPVTIKYAEEIAYLTNYFHLTEWKTVNNVLSKVPWFI